MASVCDCGSETYESSKITLCNVVRLTNVGRKVFAFQGVQLKEAKIRECKRV